MTSVSGDAGTSNPLFPDRKFGVWGQSDDGYGVAGTSNKGNGVQGGSIDGIGTVGTSESNVGVIGISKGDAGVYGRSDKAGSNDVENPQPGGIGVKGENNLDAGFGVLGQADGTQGTGVMGLAIGSRGTGVSGASNDGTGVQGDSTNGVGVMGRTIFGTGVAGSSSTGSGVFGSSLNVAIFAQNFRSNHTAYLGALCCAGDFYGEVDIHGTLQLFKPPAFKIDHPLDPANKYLSHSFVESPDMKNIYDGVAIFDAEGKAVVKLPDWFEALNRDFCYQITSIGGAGQNLYIAEEINNNCFTIAGGAQGTKVSWQVTGIRNDAVANTNRIKVVEEKPEKERGYYLHPNLYNEPEEKSVQWARYPEQIKLSEETRKKLKKM